METQRLKDAALCSLKFLEIYSGKNYQTKRYKALKALAELTLSDLKKGKKVKECAYNAYEINEHISGKFTKEDSDKRNVNRYLKELSKQLPLHKDIMQVRAKENNLTATPGYKFYSNPGGGSGNYTTHCITPIELDESEQSVLSEKLPEGVIKYYLETIDNLPGWIKWINNFELSEWRIKLIAGLMILALITGLGLYFLFIIVFLNSQSSGLEIVRSFVGTSFIGITIFLPFRLLYLCVSNRIISAPILLQPSDVTNAQIECFAINKTRESTGKPIRTIRVVSYTSTCPLCNSRIEVENGGKEFYHRLIGRCIEAPIEHVYSFDRKLRIGRALRSY